MRKSVKIMAGIAGFILVLGVLFFTNAFVGNPISKMLAKKAGEEYIEKNYASLDLKKKEVFYSFKDGKYHLFVQSQKSIDTNFTILIDSFGNVQRDTYDSIEFNTWRRLDKEIREKLSPILIEKLEYDLGHARVGFGKGGSERKEELEIDMKLDINNPPLPLEATVEIFTEDLSYKRIGKIAEDIKEIMDKENIPIESFSVILLPAKEKAEKEEGKATSWNNALTVFNIPKDLLKEENLGEAIEKYNQEQNEASEKEKEAEIIVD